MTYNKNSNHFLTEKLSTFNFSNRIKAATSKLDTIEDLIKKTGGKYTLLDNIGDKGANEIAAALQGYESQIEQILFDSLYRIERSYDLVQKLIQNDIFLINELSEKTPENLFIIFDNYRLVKKLVNKYQKKGVCFKSSNDPLLFEEHISSKLERILVLNQIYNISDIRNKSINDLMKIDRIGPKTIEEIESIKEHA